MNVGFSLSYVNLNVDCVRRVAVAAEVFLPSLIRTATTSGSTIHECVYIKFRVELAKRYVERVELHVEFN